MDVLGCVCHVDHREVWSQKDDALWRKWMQSLLCFDCDRARREQQCVQRCRSRLYLHLLLFLCKSNGKQFDTRGQCLQLQGMSFMAIGFLYPSEINSNRSRNMGAAIAMVTNWIGVYIVVSITPIGRLSATRLQRLKPNIAQAFRTLAGDSTLSLRLRTCASFLSSGYSILRRKGFRSTKSIAFSR